MTKKQKIARLQKFVGEMVDCGELFVELCEGGKWKYDLEESDLMQFFSRTWAAEGFKAMLFLREFVCAPPDGEEEHIDNLVVVPIDAAKLVGKHRRNPDNYQEGDIAYYHALHGDPDWDVVFEDENWDDKIIALEDLPDSIVDALYEELYPALKHAHVEED